ncbi:MAG: hypothetical protein FJ138_15835, partial [Deltaproteobacteria bacterium]|nr:hypothetical protein [Deltaproteobacteria bacterium]
DAAPPADLAPPVDLAPPADLAPPGGAEVPPGGAEAPVDMEAPPPDMAADMAPPPPPPYAQTSCAEDVECGEYERCLSGLCRFDLRPTVYRMRGGEVFAPGGTTGPLLEVLLNSSVQNEVLNLMFEPGFYNADGSSYWFIGNGLPSAEGYEYRRNFPIQNFTGQWQRVTDAAGEEQARWELDGVRPFVLAVPTGIVEPADVATYGERFQCTTTFPTVVRVRITPERDEARGPYSRIRVNTEGYLNRADIEQIRILFNGRQISFIDYFAGIELVDLNGDGVAQEYPFHLSVEATPISFLEEPARPDRLDLRDPSPMVAQPPECEGL